MTEKTICQICGKELKTITNTHLKLHNILSKDYLTLYPNAKTTWNKNLTKETDERLKTIAQNISTTKKRLFKEGKLKSWCTGLTKETDERLKKISEKSKLYRHTDKTKQKLKDKWTDGRKEKASKMFKGKSRPASVGEKISKKLKQGYTKGKIVVYNKNKTYEEIYGIERAKKTKEKRVKTRKENGNNTAWNKNLTKKTDIRVKKGSIKSAQTIRQKWKNPEFVKKMMGHWSRNKKNRLEKQVERLLNINFPNKFKWTGDGRFSINGKIPDFTNCDGQKKIIEVNGIYWHLKKSGLDINEKNKRMREQIECEPYKEFGYKTLFLWEDECKIETNLIEKIKVFIENE